MHDDSTCPYMGENQQLRAENEAMKQARRFGLGDLQTLCGIISNSGPNGEPLACGYQLYHDGAHSWATLPTFTGKQRGQPMNERNPTCASCHQVIVAEEGDTCASIPVWQRGRVDYCDTAATVEQPAWLTDLVNATPPWPSQPCAECRRVLPLGTAHYTPKRRALCAQCYQAATVPERAPDGMLAVRVGSDPWTMVPLDNETNPVGWDVIDTSTD